MKSFFMILLLLGAGTAIYLYKYTDLFKEPAYVQPFKEFYQKYSNFKYRGALLKADENSPLRPILENEIQIWAHNQQGKPSLASLLLDVQETSEAGATARITAVATVNLNPPGAVGGLTGMHKTRKKLVVEMVQVDMDWLVHDIHEEILSVEGELSVREPSILYKDQKVQATVPTTAE